MARDTTTPSPSVPSRLVIGCMTGTSIDGIDAACVEITGRGLAIAPRFLTALSRPLGLLAQGLRDLASSKPLDGATITRLAWELGDLHAAVALELAEQVKRHHHRDIDLVCVHGQTVFHGGGRTWQIIQPAPIARALRSPVVFDLRAADVAVGGQGAPITPLADWVFFRSPSATRTIVNLGGFCNITELPRAGNDPGNAATERQLAQIQARDVCVCNQVLDALARKLLNAPYDADGAAARAGTRDPAAFAALDALLRTQARSGRSLGTGDEIAAWVDRAVALPPPHALRTAVDAIGGVIGDACTGEEILLAGGGVRNPTLVSAIGQAVERVRPARVRLTSEAGLPPEFREAAEFAVLGALAQDRVPITLPQVTRCPSPAPLSGAWVYPA